MTSTGILGVFTPRDLIGDHACGIRCLGNHWIQPGDPAHAEIISPSKVAAILGVSRFESPYRLWHRMKGLIPNEPPSDLFAVGHDYEPAAANRWRRANPGWLLSAGEVQFHIDPDKYGFPAVCTLDRRAVRGRSRRILELKTARDLSDWGDDFTDQAPEDYVAQVIAQQLFTGWTREPADLFVLGPFFNEHTYRIPYDRAVAAWIIRQCKRFYDSLAGDVPPDLDDSVATYAAVRELHPDIDAGEEVEIDAALAEEFLTTTTDLKIAESAARLAKTRVLDQMKRAQFANCNGTRIARRQPSSRGSVALYPAKGQK